MISRLGRLVALITWTTLLTACGRDPDPVAQVEIPSWAHVAPEQIAEAKKHGVPVAFENDLGMRFVLIPAGTFLMGSPEDEEGRGFYETQHEVTISRPFYMSIYEVTNGQYQRFDAEHRGPEGFDGEKRPVVMVSHDDATAFSLWASSRDGDNHYRLPSEAEWEYACRAGTTTVFCSGDDEHALQRVGWYMERGSHSVGTKRGSPWGAL